MKGLFLTAWTIEARTLPDSALVDRSAAPGAGFTRAAIDLQELCEVAGATVIPHEISQGRAALVDGAREHFPDLGCQPLVALAADSVAGAHRVDPRAKQRLVGVDIAHAYDKLGVHDKGLDRTPPTTGTPVEIVTVEAGLQRLGSQVREQGMVRGWLRRP